jgi:hypothetical protein
MRIAITALPIRRLVALALALRALEPGTASASADGAFNPARVMAVSRHLLRVLLARAGDNSDRDHR